MAFSALRTAVRCTRSVLQAKNAVVKIEQSKNLLDVTRCASSSLITSIRHQSSTPVPSNKKKNLKEKFYGTSESESDRDMEEPLGDRGRTYFWLTKMRTIHNVLDVNKDGVISYDDFKLWSDRFIELGHLSQKHKKEFRKLIDDLWEKRWGPISPYNLVTVEQFIQDMRHILNDKKLVRRAHCFLPYLFRAIDKDRSGEITFEEYKLFFECLGLSEKDASVSFNSIDNNHDGIITMREFVNNGRDYLVNESDCTSNRYFLGPLINDGLEHIDKKFKT